MTDEHNERRDDLEPRDPEVEGDERSSPLDAATEEPDDVRHSAPIDTAPAAEPDDPDDPDEFDGPDEPGGAARSAPPGAVEIGLEPLDDDSPPSSSSSSSSSEIDCPSCGAPMPGADTLVCLRCGYDLKTLKPIETETTIEEVEVFEPPLLTPPGRGGWKVPIIVAGAVGALLIICILAGMHGVHPRLVFAAELAERPIGPVPWIARLLGVVRLLVHTGLWTAGGAAGLMVVSWINAGRIGDLPLAMSRLLGIAATMKLITLLELGGGLLEWMVETAGQAGAAFAGLVALFALKPRDAGWVMATAAGVFLVIYGGARLLVWVS